MKFLDIYSIKMLFIFVGYHFKIFIMLVNIIFFLIFIELKTLKPLWDTSVLQSSLLLFLFKLTLISYVL